MEPQGFGSCTELLGTQLSFMRLLGKLSSDLHSALAMPVAPSNMQSASGPVLSWQCAGC